MDVPEIDIDKYFFDLKIQIEKKGITDNDILRTIKETWRFINKFHTECLKMQHNSIDILTFELNHSKNKAIEYKTKLKEYKDIFDKYPEVKRMIKQAEKYLNSAN